MKRHSLWVIFYNFFSNLKKNGFTLAEALIIIVMTGYALLPILGTMQNAQNRTQKFDHYSRMVRYNRSRLNQEISKASFDHNFIDSYTSYHYVVYFASATDTSPALTEESCKIMELTGVDIPPDELEKVHNPTGGAATASPSDEVKKLFGIENNSYRAYINILHAYKTEVNLYDKPKLSYDDDPTSVANTPKALLGISATTSLVKSLGFEYNASGSPIIANPPSGSPQVDESIVVEPVSYFTLVNLPVVSDAYVWMADAYNCQIIGTDPLNRAIIPPIQLPMANPDKPNEAANEPYRPVNIAVHPSQKFIAVQAPQYIYLVNTDRKSDKYGDIKSILAPTGYSKNINNNFTKVDRGIAFRPDGNYLFYRKLNNDETSYKIWAAKINYEIEDKKIKWDDDTPKEGTPKEVTGDLKDNTVAFFPAADGNLYVATSGTDNNKVFRFSMYPKGGEFKLETFVWNGSGSNYQDKEILSAAVTPDGKRLFLLRRDASNNSFLEVFDCQNGKNISSQEHSNIRLDKIALLPYSNVSSLKDSGDFMFSTGSTLGGGENNLVKRYAYTSAYNSNDDVNYAENDGKKANFKKDGQAASYLSFSPLNETMIFNNIKENMIGVIQDLSTVTSNIPANIEVKDEDFLNYTGKYKNRNSCTGFAATPVELMALGYRTGNSSNPKYGLQMYSISQGSFSSIDGLDCAVNDRIRTLSMNPRGDMILGGFGTDIANVGKYQISSSIASSTINCSPSLKAVFDNSAINNAFSLGSGACNFWHLDTAKNDPSWNDPDDNPYNRREFLLNDPWQIKDIIGLPKGGAMALYGKNDNGSSMLEWVGRINWSSNPAHANIGKYRLFARWVSTPATNAGSKTLPGYSEDYMKSIVNHNYIDGFKGRVTINTKDSFPIGSVIAGFKHMTSVGLAGGARYLTPIIVKKVNPDSDYSEYDIVDVASPIEMVCYDSQMLKQVAITGWQKGGKIKNNCYVGFYNGSTSSGPNAGTTYYIGKVDGSYTADYYLNLSSDNDKEGGAVIEGGDIKVGTRLNPYYAVASEVPGNSVEHNTHRYRDYAIQFIANNIISDSDFPPLYSQKLAVTPNQSCLAILSGGNTNCPAKVSLYDLNNYNFDQETQIEGMLVDYRLPKQSGAYDDAIPAFLAFDNDLILDSWPHEKNTRLFTKAAAFGALGNNGLTTFAEATTKHDFWASFNELPANYTSKTDLVNIGNYRDKLHANKRFFGYVRHENPNPIKAISGYVSDDIRLFIDKSYLFGRYESRASVIDKRESYVNPYNKVAVNDRKEPLLCDLPAFSSSLFQLEQASNKGGNHLSLFFNTNADKTLESDEVNYTYGSHTASNSLKAIALGKGWFPLVSPATYILKFKPTLMCSKTFGTDQIAQIDNIEGSSMLFSRDLAEPALYILSSEENRLFRIRHGGGLLECQSNDIDRDIKSNMVVSPDGQRLLFAIKDGNSNKIRSFDVSVESLASTIDQLKQEDYDIGKEATSLAVKPFTSFSSAPKGGTYKDLPLSYETSPDMLKTQTNTALTVASGGIYIYNANTLSVLKWDPILNQISLAGHTPKTAPYSPMAAYDDVLYIFGNYGTTDNPMSGQVQSFDPTSNKTMDSIVPNTVGDEYWANPCALINVGDSNTYSDPAIKITGVNSATALGDDSKKVDRAFDGSNGDGWRTTSTEEGPGKLTYELKSSLPPLVVNKLKLHYFASVPRYTVKNFDFIGHYENPFGAWVAKTLISNGIFPDENDYEISFPNDKACKKYEFVLKTPRGGGKVKGIGEIKMYRTGVKKLTPNGSPIGDKHEKTGNFGQFNHCYYATWSGGRIAWSEPKSDGYHLTDVYKKNYGINYYNNRNHTSGEQGWKTGTLDQGMYIHWIMVTPKENEIANIVRYCNRKRGNHHGRIKKFSIYGTNKDPIEEGSLVLTSDYTEIAEFNSCPDVANTWVTYEFNNNTRYKSYIFVIKDGKSNFVDITGFELYASNSSDAEEPLSQDCMTSLVDDNLNEIKVGAGAACTTPYGIVHAGGHAGGDIATQTALLYWPHAINRYDGQFYNYGIPRSLPPMTNARLYHSLVWHKGKIYALGGSNSKSAGFTAYGYGSFAEFLDYNGASGMGTCWKLCDNFKYADGADSSLLNRYWQGACSFGDEIFVFGGKANAGGKKLTTAFAWNPETGRIRKLTDLPKGLSPCNAVAYGSKIYIYGEEDNNLFKYEYTP